MNYYADWDEAFPRYRTNPPFHSLRFKTYIHVGTTVSFIPTTQMHHEWAHNETKLVYGRIVSSNFNGTKISLNIFLPFEKTFLNDSLYPISSGNLKCVPELVQTMIKIDIMVNDINDICFIFSHDCVATGLACCEGILNAFCVRYCFSTINNSYCLLS